MINCIVIEKNDAQAHCAGAIENILDRWHACPNTVIAHVKLHTFSDSTFHLDACEKHLSSYMAIFSTWNKTIIDPLKIYGSLI